MIEAVQDDPTATIVEAYLAPDASDARVAEFRGFLHGLAPLWSAYEFDRSSPEGLCARVHFGVSKPAAEAAAAIQALRHHPIVRRVDIIRDDLGVAAG